MAVQQLGLAEEQGYRSRGHLARAWSRLIRKKIGVLCMITLLVVYSGSIFANWITPYSYREMDSTAIRKPPSLSHWAGTDQMGRDLFTRVLWGVRNTVILTVVGMLTGGLLIGVTLGLVSGYFGKKIDAVIMRSGEVLTLIPTFFLVIILAATLRPRIRLWVIWLEDNTFLEAVVRVWWVDYLVISIALVIFGWFATARLVRGQILFLKEAQHVEAARAIGASTPRILFQHLLPNAISPIVVTVSMSMGSMVGVEIFLSWVGLGIQPPMPSLGRMLWDAGNINVLQVAPWLLLAPGIASWLMVLSWNLLGDALNDVLNPRTR